MSGLVLKLIALGTMLIDHIAACLNRSGHFPPGNFSGAIIADGAFSDDPNLCLICSENSTAKEYAVANGIEYITEGVSGN